MSFCLRVAGAFACFTRPEMKVERMSYEVITPSAARGVFEAIYWKPQMRWEVVKIEVLNPIRWMNLRRNEVGAIATEKRPEIFIEDERQQRASLLLRDVAYRLHARVVSPRGGRLESADWGKCAEMFRRRARVGQCFHQPYLGCREFAADFSLVDDPALAAKKESPIPESADLGYMLYDVFDFRGEGDAPVAPSPLFFRARMQKGVIRVSRPSGERETRDGVLRR